MICGKYGFWRVCCSQGGHLLIVVKHFPRCIGHFYFVFSHPLFPGTLLFGFWTMKLLAKMLGLHCWQAPRELVCRKDIFKKKKDSCIELRFSASLFKIQQNFFFFGKSWTATRKCYFEFDHNNGSSQQILFASLMSCPHLPKNNQKGKKSQVNLYLISFKLPFKIFRI